CQQGYQLLQAFGGDAIRKKIRCFFLFEHESESNRVLDECGERGIFARKASLDVVTRYEPILRGTTSIQSAIEVRDCPVDTSAILRKLALKLRPLGVRFLTVGTVSDTRLKRQNGIWEVGAGNTVVHARAVVLCSGPYIPTMLARLCPGQEFRFRLTK